METAVDILEKAGETFSSRPHFIIGKVIFLSLNMCELDAYNN